MNLSPPGVPVNQREERRQTQETCVWYNPDSASLHQGVIVNESASGLLLKSARLQEINKTLYVLSNAYGENAFDTITKETVLQHPMTRLGTVVRHESMDLMGIRFEDAEDRPQFRRWFRGKSTITTLVFPRKCILTLSGEFSLEAGSVVQSFLGQQTKDKEEVLISVQDITAATSTALALLRSTIRRCTAGGRIVTLVTGEMMSPSGSLYTSFANEPNVIVGMDLAFSPVSQANAGEAGGSATPGDAAATTTALLISPSLTTLNRYAQPLEKMNFRVIKEKLYEEAIRVAQSHWPEFIIVDMEMEQCGQILKLNEIKKLNRKTDPLLMIIGPSNIEPLIRAALRLPVKVYVTKPATDRDYTGGLQSMLLSLPKDVLDRHTRINAMSAKDKKPEGKK